MMIVNVVTRKVVFGQNWTIVTYARSEWTNMVAIATCFSYPSTVFVFVLLLLHDREYQQSCYSIYLFFLQPYRIFS